MDNTYIQASNSLPRENKKRIFLFYVLFVVNYFIMGSTLYFSFTLISLPCEVLQILLVFSILIDSNNWFRLKYVNNAMLTAILIWIFFSIAEIFNNTAGLGIDPLAWLRRARLISFQLLWVFLICGFIFNDYKKIHTLLIWWAALSLLSVIWAMRQKSMGFNTQEMVWLIEGDHARTHIVNGLIRYFSFFSDAANYGCNMAASSAVFFLVGIISKIKKERIFFIIVGIATLYATFLSGTRTAIFSFAISVSLYVVLSKSVKGSIVVFILGFIFIFILAFTRIGQGNTMIRRMRTAFDKNDASRAVRDINQQAMAKVLKDAPFGIGIGITADRVPVSNKYRVLVTTPPDSSYVSMWIETGIIGEYLFAFCNILMLGGACFVVYTKLKDKMIRGIGAAFCCGFLGIQLGGYGNNILLQYPNTLLFYGTLAIVYVLPFVEPYYIKEQEEKGKILLEKEDEKK